MNSIEKITKILRADKDFILKIEKRFSQLTGKREVFDGIVFENEEKIKKCFLTLGIPSSAKTKEVYDALISKIEADDHRLFESLGRPLCYKQKDCLKVLNLAHKLVQDNHGFFLKKEKAADFLRRQPPERVIKYLGYPSVEKMLQSEDLFEIYSALRFIEGNNWLNNVFFKQYTELTPADFEEREMRVVALSEKWNKAAESFVAKKWHNISHLKELGVVFVLPVSLGISGELLRMLSLIFHYLHEIPFYSDIFKRIAEDNNSFAAHLISLLRGDVIEKRLTESDDKSLWLVIQRYLAKEDENEWRLFVPHINPEAIYWQKAMEDLIKVGTELNGFSDELSFWSGLDWVGDYFKDEVGNNVLVSFNLVDTVMSLVKEKEMVKYLYHHQEALWNKIFETYFSSEALEQFSKAHLLKGYFEI